MDAIVDALCYDQEAAEGVPGDLRNRRYILRRVQRREGPDAVGILVIEDEPKIARALKQGLEDEHYEFAVATRGDEGFFRLASKTVDLVILRLHCELGFTLLYVTHNREEAADISTRLIRIRDGSIEPGGTEEALGPENSVTVVR